MNYNIIKEVCWSILKEYRQADLQSERSGIFDPFEVETSLVPYTSDIITALLEETFYLQLQYDGEDYAVQWWTNDMQLPEVIIAEPGDIDREIRDDKLIELLKSESHQ